MPAHYPSSLEGPRRELRQHGGPSSEVPFSLMLFITAAFAAALAAAASPGGKHLLLLLLSTPLRARRRRSPPFRPRSSLPLRAAGRVARLASAHRVGTLARSRHGARRVRAAPEPPVDRALPGRVGRRRGRRGRRCLPDGQPAPALGGARRQPAHHVARRRDVRPIVDGTSVAPHGTARRPRGRRRRRRRGGPVPGRRRWRRRRRNSLGKVSLGGAVAEVAVDDDALPVRVR